MRSAAFLFAAAAAFAQTAAAPGIVRGDLLEWDAGRAGEFSIRTASFQVYRFSFDAKTYFERDHERSTPAKLQKGDLLEVVSDRVSASTLQYARTVHVLERPSRRASRAGRPYRLKLDRIIPMGDLTFAGVIARLNDDRMVLRTRRGGDQTISINSDTTYVENGLEVEASALKPNIRVFVRGSRNFENEVVAYQVMWGQILEPRR